ncbi:MAG: hypothetical protein A49_25150 [Methyloceanibacter sp.]|nr:MAG: hypothetical protein A49_25150 [Methyloceanibacter sp.]
MEHKAAENRQEARQGAAQGKAGASPAAKAGRGARKGRRRKSWRARHPWLWRLALALAAVIAAVLGSLVLFRFVNPPVTSVMIMEKASGETLKRRWVPIEKMSPHLRLAVIASEDGNFCTHQGVDWGASGR